MAKTREHEIHPWYYDEYLDPICGSSFWDGWECTQRSTCLFSHQQAKYYNFVPLGSFVWQNYETLFKVLKQYADNNRETNMIVDGFQDNTYNEDISQLEQIMKEMKIFQKGVTDQRYYYCPFLTQTGNCLFGQKCIFVHSSDDVQQFEKSMDWFPVSADCACCQGYIFGCGKSQCRDEGRCQDCRELTEEVNQTQQR